MKALLSLFLSFQLAQLALAAVSPDQLVEACRAGDLEKTRQLLGKNGKADVVDQEGLSPLLSAMFAHKADLVAFLLQHGADPNRITRCPEARCPGHPALIFAVYLDEPKMVKLLVDAKADLSWNDHLVTRRANVERKLEIFKTLRAAGGQIVQKPLADSSTPVPAPAKGVPAGISELLPASPSPARRAGEKLRLAIIADEATQSMADLLAADLTTGSFEMVERAELKRVIDEQKLTGQLAVEAAGAPRLGSLFGADALVLIRKVEISSQPVVEVRVVRVSPGLVLDTHYRAWPLPDANAWASDAAERLGSLAAKLRGSRGIALSPADFRPATNTAAAVSLARETALLVADRFLRQPDVVLLERSAITQLAQEQVIGKSGGFWAGSYLVDGTAEAALDSTGEAKLTLRLQPVDKGPAQTLTARGPRARLGSLVEELVAQAAKSLALVPSTSVDLKKEAALHFAESREAYARSLFLTAWREAETASLLGLRSPEFTEWHLKADLGVILWQAIKLSDGQSVKPVCWAGWDDAWMNARMGGNEWMHPVEWLDTGRQCVELWREVLMAAIESGDPQRVTAAVKAEPDVVGASLITWDTLNTASGLLEHDDQLKAIPQILRETFEQALAAIDLRPELGEAQSTLAAALARRAAVLYPEAKGYESALAGLLTRHFAFDDLDTRVQIRAVVMNGSNFSSIQLTDHSRQGESRPVASVIVPRRHRLAALPAFLTLVGAGTTAEDQMASEALRFQAAKDPAQRVIISDRFFALLWEKRQLFIEEPRALSMLTSADGWFVASRKDAPKFANLNPGGGDIVLTPEMKKLRRDLFLLVARNAQMPEPARALLDADYHPPDEDAVELEVLQKKVDESAMARFAKLSTLGNPPALPKALPLKTPTYAAYPPLQITRQWHPKNALPDLGWGFTLFFNSFKVVDEVAWVYAEVWPDEGPLRSYLFEIPLSTMRAKVWALPEVPEIKSQGRSTEGIVAILPERDRIFLTKPGAYLAVVDRRTGQWEINRELQPTSQVVRVGADLFFLTESLGARGFVRYSPETKKVELLSSNRQTPIRNPLDDPAVRALRLGASETGKIEIVTGPATIAGVTTRADLLRDTVASKVVYDPAAGTWTNPEVLPPDPAATQRVTVPLHKPGPAKAYKKNQATNLWTLQTSRENMPKVRLPIEFVEAKHKEAPKEAFTIVNCQWTKKGYALLEPSGPERQGILWFLPQADLDAYLDGHEPGEDDPSSITPQPLKPR